MAYKSKYLKQTDFHGVQNLFKVNVSICILACIFIFQDLLDSKIFLLEAFPPLFFLMINFFSLLFLFIRKIQIAKLITIFLMPLSIFSIILNGYPSDKYIFLAPVALIGLSSISFLIFNFKQEKSNIIIAIIYYLLLIIFSELILKIPEIITNKELLIVVFNDHLTIKTKQVFIFCFNIYILYHLAINNENNQLDFNRKDQELKYKQSVISDLFIRNNAIDSLIDIMITNPKGIISYVNQRFSTNTKYKPEEIIGKNPRILDFNYYSDSFLKKIWKTILSGKIWSGEIKNKRKDDSVYWVQSLVAPLHSNNRKIIGYLCLMVDITNLKENEKKLERKNKSIEKVIAAISHDLKAPIKNIRYLCEWIYYSKVNQNEKDKIHELIIDLCDQSIIILEELLEVSELEDEASKLEKQKTNLNEFIIQILKPFKEQIKQSKLQLELQLSKETIHIKLNQVKFGRAINNIISNSIKFTPIKGIISVKTYFIENRKVRIEIADTGIGIPKELQPILFDRFTKASRKGLKNESSTGLGMSIVKQIIELHGGSISLKSSEGSGTTFYLDLEIC